MVTVTPNGDVPQQPMNFDNSYVPDQLIAGVYQRVTDNVTVLHGATVTPVSTALTVLPRGTVLGQVTLGTASSAFTGTGNGAMTALSTQPNAVAGAYKAIVEIAGTNTATWNLYNPSGKLIDQKIITGSGLTAVFANTDLHFTITDGSTDFIVGDFFVITVAAGSLKYIPSVITATDGSQIPLCLLADDCDPTAADVNAGVYLSGEFNSGAMTFDSGWTAATLKAPLQGKNIYLKTANSAADPT